MLELLLKRRSCRTFEDRVVEDEKVEKLLMAAQLSPSGKNTRPWEFVVIKDKETLNKLGACRYPNQPFLPKAPLALVVLGDKQKTDTWIEDTSIASILIQLEAQDLGLGSCWVQIRLRESSQGESSEDFVQKLLAIPQHMGVLSIIAVGYPQNTLPPHSLPECHAKNIHLECYQTPNP